MSEPDPRSNRTLLGDALRGTRELVSKEIALFRAEIAEAVHHLSVVLGFFVAAAVFLPVGFRVLILASVKGLTGLVHSDALSALIVGAAFASVAFGLASWWRGKVSLAGLESIRTERQVRQDAGIITERMSE